MGHQRALATLAVSLSLFGLTVCNPAIYRARGIVTTARFVDGKDAEICLQRAVKAAGSTYGKAPVDGRICMDGMLDSSVLPPTGACVVLQSQGEGSTLKVEASTGCS